MTIFLQMTVFVKALTGGDKTNGKLEFLNYEKFKEYQ